MKFSLLSALALLLPVADSASAGIVATTLQSPFADTTVVNSTDVVQLSGSIVTITVVAAPSGPCTPTAPCRNVPVTVTTILGASGVGHPSGRTYYAAGASTKLTTTTLPGALSVPTSYRVLTPILGPIVSLQDFVTFNAQGTATAASAPPSGLVSWWRAEGDAADVLGRNPGTLQETVGFVPGRVGQAFEFQGLGFVDVAGSPTLQVPTVTAMAWVKNLGFPGSFDYVLSQGAAGCSAASYALHTGLGGVRFYVNGDLGFVESPAAGPQVWDGAWHLVAGTFDGSMVRLYVDGVEVGTGTPTAQPINYALQTNQRFYIGAYRGSCELRFTGDIDEVRVFNRALSPVEIQSILSGTPKP